jgi:hypothetical protein
MNKTLYIRDEDAPIWDRARKLADEKKLSPVIVDALKRFIADREAEETGFERIVLRYSDYSSNGLPKAKAFYGRWIYPIDQPLRLRNSEENGYEGRAYAIAITSKNNVVFYGWDYDPHSNWKYTFDVFPSFEEASADPVVGLAANFAYGKLGVPVEELDI